ncbi:hypothetical protein ZOSMA_206G00170 [Zostera marina]|uniref:Transmembrane protein n=1 Tax=Zostera marina TaxID=29655 RepID=A0A0K9PL69_ZOSMR|nr:hypothetical protein ZOSMA_206G00170 [Zostera marina]
MRCLGFWVVFIPTTLYLLILLRFGTRFVSSPDDDIFNLKTTGIDRNFKKKIVVRKLMIEEDYPGLDPAPSSKASIHPKPIEHGTPLMPYAPVPPPPPPPPMFF